MLVFPDPGGPINKMIIVTDLDDVKQCQLLGFNSMTWLKTSFETQFRSDFVGIKIKLEFFDLSFWRDFLHYKIENLNFTWKKSWKFVYMQGT